MSTGEEEGSQQLLCSKDSSAAAAAARFFCRVYYHISNTAAITLRLVGQATMSERMDLAPDKIRK